MNFLNFQAVGLKKLFFGENEGLLNPSSLRKNANGNWLLPEVTVVWSDRKWKFFWNGSQKSYFVCPHPSKRWSILHRVSHRISHVTCGMYEQVGFDLPVVIRSTSESYMNIKKELVKICISKYRLLLRTCKDIDVKNNKSWEIFVWFYCQKLGVTKKISTCAWF